MLLVLRLVLNVLDCVLLAQNTIVLIALCNLSDRHVVILSDLLSVFCLVAARLYLLTVLVIPIIVICIIF